MIAAIFVFGNPWLVSERVESEEWRVEINSSCVWQMGNGEFQLASAAINCRCSCDPLQGRRCAARQFDHARTHAIEPNV